MEKAISEIVGRADLDEGGSAKVYRALRSLLCATCGLEISEGSLFTRGRLKGIGVRIMPHCSKCAPFTLQAGKKEKSTLLRSLLTKQPEDSIRRSDASALNSSDNILSAIDEEKNIDAKVRQRLGPALRISRLRRK
jgi:hypothetical protein